jgi:hypothetical protein
MKARIKETGEIIDVECRFYAKVGSTDPIIHSNSLEILKDDKIIDWEQRRYEIARDFYVRYGDWDPDDATKRADALINELKGE